MQSNRCKQTSPQRRCTASSIEHRGDNSNDIFPMNDSLPSPPTLPKRRSLNNLASIVDHAIAIMDEDIINENLDRETAEARSSSGCQ